LMASDVAPGCACVIKLTTTPAVPIPAGAVVSRAPKTWIEGQLSRSMTSIGEARTCASIRRVIALDNILEAECKLK
jgi:hypothetical protein